MGIFAVYIEHFCGLYHTDLQLLEAKIMRECLTAFRSPPPSEEGIEASPFSRCRAGVGGEAQTTGYQGKLIVRTLKGGKISFKRGTENGSIIHSLTYSLSHSFIHSFIH